MCHKANRILLRNKMNFVLPLFLFCLVCNFHLSCMFFLFVLHQNEFCLWWTILFITRRQFSASHNSNYMPWEKMRVRRSLAAIRWVGVPASLCLGWDEVLHLSPMQCIRSLRWLLLPPRQRFRKCLRRHGDGGHTYWECWTHDWRAECRPRHRRVRLWRA